MIVPGVGGELDRPQTCLENVARLQAMAAVWKEQDSSNIIGAVLDMLVRLLSLDFAYARVGEFVTGTPIELACLAQERNPPPEAREIGRALDQWLDGQPDPRPRAAANPVGEGETRIAPFNLGFHGRLGTLVAGSKRPEFPTQTDILTLRVAVDQVAIALQEVCCQNEQSRAPETRNYRQPHPPEAVLMLAREEAWRRAREAEEAQSVLHTIMENVPEGFTLAWGPPDFPIIANSKYAAKLIGRKAGSLLNIPAGLHAEAYGLLLPDGSRPRPEQLPLYRASRNGEVIENEEWVMERPDGSRIHQLSNVAPIRDFRGQIIGAINCWWDITARKRSEEKLRRSEMNLAAGQRLSHTASWSWTVSTGEVFWSQELFRIYGLDADKAKPGYPSVLDYIHPDDQLRAKKIFEDAVREKKEYELQCRVVQPDGTIRHVNNLARPVFNDFGILIEYVGATIDITEQKRATEALRESEERFRHCFELGLIGMAITSPTKGILEVNDELCRVLGYERNELLQMTWAEITYPDDLAADVAAFNRVIADEHDGYSLDKRWIRKDGRVINSIMAAKCLRRPDRSVDYFVGLVLDTTARKRVEEELRRSEEYLAEGQRISRTGSWGWTVATGRVIWSRETYRIFGVDPSEEEPAYDMVMRRVHSADRERVDKEAQRAAREWSDFKIEFRIQLANGTIKHLEARGHPVENGKAHSGEFIGAVMDITERKQAEEKIRESEHRFRLLVESIPHHVWSFRADGSVGYWNQRLIDYTGLTQEELLHGGWAALHPDDLGHARSAWQTAMVEGTDFESEQRIRGRDGGYRRFVCCRVAVKNERGLPVEWFGTDTDVEDRRRAEESLHKLQEELARVSRVTSMGEMAASIAHELNQPLGAIVNNSNFCLRLMADRPSQDADLRDTLEDIVKDANRASAIIARVRSLIKSSPPERTSLQLKDVLADVLALAQRELAERHITTRAELLEDLPLISGDRVELQQVLLNLVINASDAMSALPEERRVLTINGWPEELEGRPAAMIAVRDLGHGFDAADAERLFDAFYTSKAHGLGMGLRISRSIVERHGGRLWATVNEQGGATFICVLPGET